MKNLIPLSCQVTGSTGKTTLTNALYHALFDRYKLSKVKSIRTTYLGLIWHILHNMSEETDYLLIEMQTDGFGQIDKYCEIIKLDAAFIVNVNLAHIKRFGSVKHILGEKLAVYRGLKNDGKLYIDIDNDILRQWSETVSDSRIITVGMLHEAEYQVVDSIRNNGVFSFNIKQHSDKISQMMTVNDLGGQSIKVAVFLSAFLFEKGYLEEEIRDAVYTIPPVVGRFQRFFGIHDSLIIVDSYNASYESTIYGIEYLLQLKCTKRVIIIGSLLELADDCEQIHRKVGKYIKEHKGIDYVIALGEATVYILDEISDEDITIYHSFSYQEIISYIKKLEIDKETAVYIKGSGAMRMELIAMHLLADSM